MLTPQSNGQPQFGALRVLVPSGSSLLRAGEFKEIAGLDIARSAGGHCDDSVSTLAAAAQADPGPHIPGDFGDSEVLVVEDCIDGEAHPHHVDRAARPDVE